jgi:hypothetical protein
MVQRYTIRTSPDFMEMKVMARNEKAGEDAGINAENRKAPGKVVFYSEKKYLNKILPVRLPSEKLEQIKQEARELGTSPSALARIWILDALRRLSGEAPDDGEYSRAKRKAHSAKSRKEARIGH